MRVGPAVLALVTARYALLRPVYLLMSSPS